MTFTHQKFIRILQKIMLHQEKKLVIIITLILKKVFLLIKNGDKELEGIVSNLGDFETRSIRNVLISNDSIEGQIVYDVVNIIMRNNNFLLNKILYNKFSNTEHALFEPVDIIYIDKNIRYHKGSRNFYEQMKFLTFDKRELSRLQTDSDEKFDYYWKYSKRD